MNLIERIDGTLGNGYQSLGNYSALSVWELLADCRAEIQRLTEARKESLALGLKFAQERETSDAEIQRLLTANEALKGLCDEYQAQIKAQGEYVPMTNAEHYELWAKTYGSYMPSEDWNQDSVWEDERAIEAEVIKRAGLRVKERDNG